MRIGGVIGWMILSRYAVNIDYDTMQIELYDTQRSTFDFAGQGFEVEVQGTVIFAAAKAVLAGGETFTGKVLVDTGSGGTLTFNAPFAKANGLVEKIGSYYEREIQSLSTDRARLYTGMLSSIHLGTFQFNSVPAGIAVAEAGALSWPRIMGILGNGILRRFNLSIDLQRKRVFLKPNQAYGEAFETNCSGLELVLDDTFSKVIVDHVYLHSPAEAAGLKVGDEVVQINGANASQLPLAQIRSMLSKDGKEVEIVVDRKGEPHKYLLRLRALIGID